MKRATLTLLLLLSSVAIFAEYSERFAQWSERFSSLLDPNTGLTVFPTLLIPAGGTYEGMGTAFTALAHDPSGLEANPAGSSYFERDALALFHNDWIADTVLETAVFVKKREDMGIGIGVKSLWSPFSHYDASGERQGSGYFSETLILGNVSSTVLSIDGILRIAFGLNIKWIYRYVSKYIVADQSILALPVDVGILGRFMLPSLSGPRRENLSIGAVVSNLGRAEVHSGYPLPSVVSIGLAYSPITSVTASGDLNIPISFVPREYPAERFDVSAGLNISPTSFLSLHTGVRFMSDNPRFSLNTVQLSFKET